MAKDRTKEILKELKALRREMSSRLDALESRLDAVAGSAEPEDRAVPHSSSDSVAASLPGIPPARHFSPPPEVPAQAAGGVGSAETGAERFRAPSEGEVQVVVSPLRDLSLARVVETALAETEGVHKATLRELRGDSATIDVVADEGISLIGSLRRKLPVAFDVTDSDERSVTIALAQPVAGRDGGVAAPPAP
ncbi:MAG: hypothetical protein M3Y45_09225 [Actinomycetota bacterium]|nr:hypothetical protein [Actinomycetota bacterium]